MLITIFFAYFCVSLNLATVINLTRLNTSDNGFSNETYPKKLVDNVSTPNNNATVSDSDGYVKIFDEGDQTLYFKYHIDVEQNYASDTTIISSGFWTPGNCNFTHCIRNNMTWTYHGLWLNVVDCPGPGITIENISNVYESLLKYWPDHIHSDPMKFYSHEWHKHGRCFNMRFNYTPEEYFSRGLQLYFQFIKMQQHFEMYNIKPSATQLYPLSRLEEIGELALGSKPTFVCMHHKDEYYKIVQSHVCYSNSDFITVDCERHMSCPESVLLQPLYQVDE